MKTTKKITKKTRKKKTTLGDLNRMAREVTRAKALERRDPLPAPFAMAEKGSQSQSVYSRQIVPEDVFMGKYSAYGLIVPPYNPVSLYSIYETSSVLSPNIDAYIQNIDGFDLAFKYKGPTGKKDSEEAIQEKQDLKNFFKRVNESESLQSIRRSMRLDYEITGNGYFEVSRSADGEIACIYHMDARHIRAARATEEDYQEITVQLFRGGKLRPITVKKKFRRYAQYISTTGKIRWFKEYGDPRKLDATDGKYKKKPKEVASEIIHFKIGTGVYGLPRWIGNTMGILGVRNADYVNYDLFDSQGIPPLVILVSGGILTTESIGTIKALLKQAKGYKNFNRILLLEAQAEGGIDDKTTPRVDLKPMTDAKAEDALFQGYIKATEEKVRTDFRLPPVYLGKAQEYTRATIEFSKIIVEEQVFEAERNKFDEKMENTIMIEINTEYWEFKSGRPPLVTGEGLISGFDSFAEPGVLSINQAIGIANRAMSLDLEEFDEAWADYPMAIITRLLDRGFFADLQQLVDVLEGTASMLNNPTALPVDGGVDEDTTKVITQATKELNTLLKRAKAMLVANEIKKEDKPNK